MVTISEKSGLISWNYDDELIISLPMCKYGTCSSPLELKVEFFGAASSLSACPEVGMTA